MRISAGKKGIRRATQQERSASGTQHNRKETPQERSATKARRSNNAAPQERSASRATRGPGDRRPSQSEPRGKGAFRLRINWCGHSQKQGKKYETRVWHMYVYSD